MASQSCQSFGVLTQENNRPSLRNQFSSLGSILNLESKVYSGSKMDLDLNVLPILVPSNTSHNIVLNERATSYIFSISNTTTPWWYDKVEKKSLNLCPMMECLSFTPNRQLASSLSLPNLGNNRSVKPS